MLDYAANKIYFSQDGGPVEAHEVTEYVVWWMTPFGLIPDREEALKRVALVDMPPEVVQPIPVAIYIARDVIVWYEPCLRGV